MKHLLILTFLLLTSCTTPIHQAMEKVKPGMDKSEVLQLVGSPLRSERRDGRQLWVYKFYKNGEALSRAVYLVEGEVVEIEKWAYRNSLRNKLETELEELEPIVRFGEGFVDLED